MSSPSGKAASHVRLAAAVVLTVAVVLVVGLTIGALPNPDVGVISPRPSPVAVSSASPSSSPSTATASATPNLTSAPPATPSAALLKPSFGVIYQGVRAGWDPGSAQQIKREGETDRSVGELAGSFFNQFHGAVTSDGRRAVYPGQELAGPWVLYLLDGARPTDQKRLLTLSNEIPGSLVWSSDMTGIAFTAQDAGATQGVTPKYDSIRTLDIASGAIRELARVTDGSYYQVVGWDRSTGTLAASVTPYPYDLRKRGSYIVIDPSGTKTVSLDGPSPFLASADARIVYGLRCDGNPASCSLWTWPLSDYNARLDRQVSTGLSLGIFAARSGTDDIGMTVLSFSGATVDGQVALWSPSAGLRTAYRFPAGRSPGSRPFFRADGSAVFVELGPGDDVVVDLASGAIAKLPQPAVTGRIEASIRLD